MNCPLGCSACVVGLLVALAGCDTILASDPDGGIGRPDVAHGRPDMATGWPDVITPWPDMWFPGAPDQATIPDQAAPDQAADSQLVCGTYALTVMDWSWVPDGTTGYSISTRLEVKGPEACYAFPGYHNYTKLTLSWNEGVAVDIYRIPAVVGIWHEGFGPRTCGKGYCEIGDIFSTDEVYTGFPFNKSVKQFANLYGPPDRACGHVYNADLIHKQHCAPLTQGTPPPFGGQ